MSCAGQSGSCAHPISALDSGKEPAIHPTGNLTPLATGRILMSSQSPRNQNRDPESLLSALGVDRTVAMIFAGLCVTAVLILSAVGHDRGKANQKPDDVSSLEPDSVFTDSELPGVTLEPAE